MKQSSTSITKIGINDTSLSSSNSCKLFDIVKDKRNNIESSESSFLEDEDNRVSAYSKVNFSKLSDREKDKRLKNLSTLITRLRKKIRNQESKFSSLSDKKIKNI